MAFIDTTPPADTRGDTRAMYARQQGKLGYVPNYAKVFCHRPDIMLLWADLLAGIRRHIEPRPFELATLAAAHAIGNSACSLAHGKALTRFLSEEQVRTIVEDVDASELSDAEKALVKFARKVAVNAASVDAGDIAGLRALGFADDAIFDIAAAAAARCFFAKLLDALGVLPDPTAAEMAEPLRTVLTVGRPIDTGPVEQLETE